MKKTVVLLHGFGADSSIWNDYATVLEKEYTVILPEYARLNHLKTIEDYADFVHDLLVEKGVEKCAVIGHSMGGYIALGFAEKYPQMLSGFGLFHSTSFADSEEKKQARNKIIETIKRGGSEVFIRASTPTLYAEEFAKLHPEIIQKHIEYASQFPPEALIAGMGAIRDRPDRRAVLKALRVPVMFIIGEKDKSVSPADAKSQIMMPKFFSSSILDDVAHMGMVEEAEHCLAFLERFLLKC
jgi:pimeloyl-ACP methyl ester carboxylesterase